MSSTPVDQIVIIGGGPVGLLLGALLRDQNVNVTILEKRNERTRERRVRLLRDILLTEAVVDGVYLFSDSQIGERERAISSVRPEISTLTKKWIRSSTPIKDIQKDLREHFLNAGGTLLEGPQHEVGQNLNALRNYSNALVVDCTGFRSVLSDTIEKDNRIGRIVENVLICTFVLNEKYECDELCKYHKNRNVKKYHVIPAIHETYIMNERQTFVTCLITIADNQIFQRLSNFAGLTYDYLRDNFTAIHQDLRLFLMNLTNNQLDKVELDRMVFLALPLNLYRSKKLTRIITANKVTQYRVLMGDAAMGGPYFQSISIGFEAAIYFAYIFIQMRNDIPGMLTRYEAYADKLWLKLQMNSKEIQKNKDILQAMCRQDSNAILDIIKIY